MLCIPVIFSWLTGVLLTLLYVLAFVVKISLIHDLSCFILIRPSKTEQNSQTWEEEPRSDTIASVTVSSGCWLASCDQGQVCCQVCVGRG